MVNEGKRRKTEAQSGRGAAIGRVEAEGQQGNEQRWEKGQEIRRGWWNVEGEMGRGPGGWGGTLQPFRSGRSWWSHPRGTWPCSQLRAPATGFGEWHDSVGGRHGAGYMICGAQWKAEV